MKKSVYILFSALCIISLLNTCSNENLLRLQTLASLKLQIITSIPKASLPEQFKANVSIYIDDKETCTKEILFEMQTGTYQATECIEVPLNKSLRFLVTVEIGDDYWEGESLDITIEEGVTPYLVTIYLQGSENTPTVTTASITNVGSNSATGGGEVTNDGGQPVTQRGVVWSTSQTPTIENNIGLTNDGEGLGVFTSNITGLSPGTVYYVRAYATNSLGTAYGQQESFQSSNVSVVVPTVSTNSITDIDFTSVTCGGNVMNDGGSTITARGVVWRKAPNPTVMFNDGITNEGSDLGPFSSTISGLTAESIYYVRAYATNSKGTGYGEEVEFSTAPFDLVYGEDVTDIDGNSYSTVIIGGKEWMAENLRVTHYSDNSIIPTGLSSAEWQVTTEGAFTLQPFGDIDGLNTAEEVIQAYGLLYNWYSVVDVRGLCPTGWHTPTDAEFSDLENLLVSKYGLTNEIDDLNGIGNILKSCRQENSPLEGDCATSSHPRWSLNNEHYGKDKLGFSALPGGVCDYDGYYGLVGTYCYLWTSTQTSSYAWYRMLRIDGGSLTRLYIYPRTGLSVRCIKD